MKKIIRIALPLISAIALIGCANQGSSQSVVPSSVEPSESEPAKTPSIDTKDGKRSAVIKENTFNLKDYLVLQNITFEELEVKLLSEEVATYANGVVTRKKTGTASLSIGPKDSIYGIYINVVFVPENAFNATYVGVGSGDNYKDMNVTVVLKEDKTATITLAGKYLKDGAEVPVEETVYNGTYGLKDYGSEITTNVVMYEFTIENLTEKPQFTFRGEDGEKPFSLGVNKLPLGGEPILRAICYIQQ